MITHLQNMHLKFIKGMFYIHLEKVDLKYLNAVLEEKTSLNH